MKARSPPSQDSPGCLFFFKDFIYLFFREREGRKKERERNLSVRDKYRLVASCTHPTGARTHNQARALTGNRMGDLWDCRKLPNPLSHASQGTSVTRNFPSHAPDYQVKGGPQKPESGTGSRIIGIKD